MTSSNRVKTRSFPLTVEATQTPSLKLFRIAIQKSLMWGSLKTSTSSNQQSHLLVIAYDEKRISTLQPEQIQPECQNSYCKNWLSFQVQHQLSHHLDSKVQKEITCWKGDSCA